VAAGSRRRKIENCELHFPHRPNFSGKWKAVSGPDSPIHCSTSEGEPKLYEFHKQDN